MRHYAAKVNVMNVLFPLTAAIVLFLKNILKSLNKLKIILFVCLISSTFQFSFIYFVVMKYKMGIVGICYSIL